MLTLTSSKEDIIKIVSNILTTLNNDQLNKHKNKIIQYFNINNIDVSELLKLDKNEFGKAMQKHCNDQTIVNEVKDKLYDTLKSNYIDKLYPSTESIDKYLDLMLNKQEPLIKNYIINYLNCPICSKLNCHKYDKYETHDNGGTPFTVEIYHSICQIKIFANICTYDYDENKWQYNINYVRKYNVFKVFIGKDYAYGYHGSSILLKIGTKRYVFIGHKILEFTTEDDIIHYYSMVGNSDVPYPIALGTKYVYFMLDDGYLDKKLFGWSDTEHKKWADCYTQFYDLQNGVDTKDFLEQKLIHKRTI